MDNFEHLKKSPLFNFSLGSKELFHSNFLAWLGENDSTRTIFVGIIKDFLSKSKKKIDVSWLEDFIKNPTQFDINREFMHFDLCIKRNNKPVLILENKVKSLPYFEQIDKYHKKVIEKKAWKDCNISYVLLTLIDDFIDRERIEKEWIIVSYKELADSLNILNLGCQNNVYQHFIIDDYRYLVNTLISIKDNWTFSDTLLLDENNVKGLNGLRILDLAQKLQINRLYLELVNKITNVGIAIKSESFWNLKNTKHKMKIGIGYSNKSALLDIVVFLDKDINKIEDKKDNINTLHIQLQGSQYRHAYEFEIDQKQYDILAKSIARSKAYTEKVAAISKKEPTINNYSEWLGQSLNNQILTGTLKPSLNSYNSYKGKGNGKCSLFIYHYYEINQKAKIYNIVDYLIDDIRQIITILQ